MVFQIEWQDPSALACRVNKIFEVNYETEDNEHYIVVNVKQAYDWFTPISFDWHIQPFEAASGVNVEVVDSNNTSKGSDATNSNGIAEISVPELTAGGTYTIYAYGSANTVSLSSTTDSVEYTIPVPEPTE